MSEETIYVNSVVTRLSLDPLVRITWGKVDGSLSALDARSRGFHLLKAVAIAEAEDAIFKTLVPNSRPYKGFGRSAFGKEASFQVSFFKAAFLWEASHRKRAVYEASYCEKQSDGAQRECIHACVPTKNVTVKSRPRI